MAGKSTILRSVCAVALLGSCGLLVPSASAQIPYIDAFVLRTFASDSPVEGRSGFAMEMWEMRYVLDDVSPQSLVLVDELGKGTEIQAGTALGGAIFESICDKGCFGIFATHLHYLFQLPLNEKNVRFMKMETVDGDMGRKRLGTGLKIRKPTWKMVPGKSTESLALQVAQTSGLPQKTIERAMCFLGVLNAKNLAGGASHVVFDGERGHSKISSASDDEVAGDRSTDNDGNHVLDASDLDAEASRVKGSYAGDSKGLAADPLDMSEDMDDLQDVSDSASVQLPSTGDSYAEILLGRKVSESDDGMVVEILEDCARKALHSLTLKVTDNEASNRSNDARINGEFRAGFESWNSLVSIQGQQTPETSESTTEAICNWISAQYIPPGHNPPPRVTNCTCIYVVRWTDAWCYVGETDDLDKRLRHHRRRRGKAVGMGMEAWYISVPRAEGSKSIARAIEKETIRSLSDREWPLWSAKDGGNTNFGIKG